MRVFPALGLAAAAILAAGCGKPPELTREAAADLIVHSPAFEGPWDPGIRFVDSEKTVATSDVRRRLLKVESAAVKEDGPWGIAGSTGTVVFTWRWLNGPLAGVDYRSRVKLHASRGVWKVYSDQLQEELWKSERGEE
jgi:hypothetical protein